MTGCATTPYFLFCIRPENVYVHVPAWFATGLPLHVPSRLTETSDTVEEPDGGWTISQMGSTVGRPVALSVNDCPTATGFGFAEHGGSPWRLAASAGVTRRTAATER